MKLLHCLTLLFLVSTKNRPSDAYRILGVFPQDAKSHFNMFEELMKGLAKRGHLVDVVTHYPQKEPIPNYTDISLAGKIAAPLKNLTLEFLNKDSSISMAVVASIHGDRTCKLMEHPQIQALIKNPPQDPPYDVVITELFATNCYLVFGHHLKVPVIGAMSSVLFPWMNDPVGNPDNPAYIPSIDTGYTNHMNFWQRLRNTLSMHTAKFLFNYFSSGQDEYLKKIFGPDVPSLRELEKNLALTLVNSHHSLHGVRPMTPAVVEVGGLHVRDDDSEFSPKLKKWLDESKDGFVHFTLGSKVKIESFSKETLTAMYASFAKIAPVRVLMRIVDKDELPPGLPKNVLTLPWIPQVKVLKHENVRAFITHGGLMGTQEAVHYAVPMIGIPVFGDQPANINGYVEKKVAVSLDFKNITEENFTAALKAVLNDPSYKKAAKRLSEQFLDRPMNALDTAIFWVEYVVRNGNSLRSPAVDLTWWQIALLDVYGTLLLVAIAVIYTSKLLYGVLFRKLTSGKKVVSKSKKVR